MSGQRPTGSNRQKSGEQPPRRAAFSAIAGFAYQFDLSIHELLAADKDSTVTIEGIEDVDIFASTGAEAIQCKYHAAQKYSLLGLRKPILSMLEGYADGRTWTYRLYVHFGDRTGLVTRLTLDELRRCLTETKRDGTTIRHYERYTQNVLDSFLEHFTIEPGPSFNDQQSAVQGGLMTALNASAEDVRDLHYPNALSLVMELARQPRVRDRRLTRAAFLSRLNLRPVLYTRWHKEYIGHDRFKKGIKRRLKAADLLTSKRRRLMMLAVPSQADGLVSLTTLLQRLATRMYGRGKLSDTKPWTVVLQAPDADVATVKKELIQNGIAINDGYEHLDFSTTMFDRDPLINTKGTSKLIDATSYDIRLISYETYKEHMSSLRRPTVVVNFTDLPVDYAVTDGVQMLAIPGWPVEDIHDMIGAGT